MEGKQTKKGEMVRQMSEVLGNGTTIIIITVMKLRFVTVLLRD